MTQLLLAVVAVLTITATVASARVIEILNAERGFRATWSALEFTSALGTVTCPVTLEGSFDRFAIEKVAGTKVATVTGASVGVCSRGAATVLRETLPWEITYDSFTGTLPLIASVRQRLLGAAFQLRSEFLTCLARSEAGNPLILTDRLTREAGGLLEVSSTGAEGTVPMTGSGCETVTARVSGTSSSTTVQGETAKIRVRLIEALPTVTLSPGTVEILVGQIRAERKYRIRNTTPAGGANIRIRSIGLSDAVRFAVEDAGGRCTGRVLAPQATCEFEVNYNAAFEAERPRMALVRVFWEGGVLEAITTAR